MLLLTASGGALSQCQAQMAKTRGFLVPVLKPQKSVSSDDVLRQEPHHRCSCGAHHNLIRLLFVLPQAEEKPASSSIVKTLA